jgi:intein/homing endonuclease
MLFKELAKPENIVKMPRVARIAFVRGLYDAEGDKSKKRIRIWSKNIEVLNIANQVLAELGIGSKGPYLDDKRRGVYVVEVPRAYASQFYSIIKPEHPKLGVDTGPHPRKFRRA